MQDAAERGQAGPERPDDPDHAVHRDAGRGGQRGVVRDRAGRTARPGCRAGSTRRRRARWPRSPCDHSVVVVIRTGPMADRRRGVRDDAQRAGAEEELEHVRDRHRQTDRDDHLLDHPDAASAQRLPQPRVLQPPGGRAERDRDDRRRDQRQPDQLRADVREDAAERHLLAVREVAQAGRAVDQGEPDAREREERAEHQTVDGELGDARRGHARTGGAGGRGDGGTALGVGRRRVAGLVARVAASAAGGGRRRAGTARPPRRPGRP